MRHAAYAIGHMAYDPWHITYGIWLMVHGPESRQQPRCPWHSNRPSLRRLSWALADAKTGAATWLELEPWLEPI